MQNGSLVTVNQTLQFLSGLWSILVSFTPLFGSLQPTAFLFGFIFLLFSQASFSGLKQSCFQQQLRQNHSK